MFIFLDESGNLGFNIEQSGVTKYFVLTLLVVNDINNVQAISHAVTRTLRRKVNHRAKQFKKELKGTETTINTKAYFYSHIEKVKGWTIYSVIFDKEKLIRTLEKIPSNKNFYNYLVRIALENIDFSQLTFDIRLVVDRSKNKKEIHEFNIYLANHLSALLPLDKQLKIEHQTSTENKGLQAVDLFAWGIYRKYEAKDCVWYNFYKERIELEIMA